MQSQAIRISSAQGGETEAHLVQNPTVNHLERTAAIQALQLHVSSMVNVRNSPNCRRRILVLYRARLESSGSQATRVSE